MNNYNDIVEKEERLCITLEGDDSIQLDTLLSFVDSTGKVLKKSSKSVFGSNGNSEILVEKIEQGSIIFNLVEKIKTRTSMIPISESSFSMYLDFLAIKRHIGDGTDAKVIQAGEKDQYINGLGESLMIKVKSSNTYLNDPNIDKLISTTMNKVNNDLTRKNIKVVYNNSEQIVLNENDIIASANQVDIEKLRGSIKEQIVHLANVGVEKVDFSGTTKWSINIGNTKENVIIEDFEFLNEVKESKHAFNSNTRLLVDYKVEYQTRFDLENSKRKLKITILKVHKVINSYTEAINIDN